MHFDEAITSTPRDFMNDEESSKKFIRVTTKRFCDIYEDFAKLLQPLRIGGHLSSTQETRKAILLSFLKNSDYKLYYVAGEGDGERDVEFDQEDNFGWMHTWVSVAKENSDSTLNSLTIGIESSECHIEVGERKDPRKSLIDTDNQSWWSLGMVMTETVESKNLTRNSVMELVDKASQNLGIHL